MSIKNLVYYLIMSLCLLMTGCSFYVPKQQVILQSENYFFLESQQLNYSLQCRYQHSDRAINASSIKVLSWNSMAGCREPLKKLTTLTFCSSSKADESFLELARNKDLILIQEAFLDKTRLNKLEQLGEDYSWDMAISYITDTKQDIPAGVLTIAKAQSVSSCPVRIYESILPTPKAILFTSYQLSNNANQILGETLLVANVHAVLFGQEVFSKQLEDIKNRIIQHEGPVIMAGDFNTMTSERYQILKQTIKELKMHEYKIPDADDNRVKSIKGHVYDFVFYKNLYTETIESIDLNHSKSGKTSDHNPIIAEFKFIKQ